MATFHYDYEYLLTWKPERERLTRPVYQSLAKALEDDIASGAFRPEPSCRLSGNWPTSSISTLRPLPGLIKSAN